jgi:cytochrome b6-f complex iron-sulfur subunit
MRPELRPVLGTLAASVVAGIAVGVERFHEPTSTKLISRRSFIRNAVLGAVIIGTVELAGGIVRLLWPNKTGAFGREIPVPMDLVPPVGEAPYRNQAGKFFIINNGDGALALYWKCPHLGCTVPWNESEDRWHCPCHGSIYNRHGERVAGPAPRPMDLMPMRVDGPNVIVDSGTIIERSQWELEQSLMLPT